MKQLDFSRLAMWKTTQQFLSENVARWNSHSQFSSAASTLNYAIARADKAIGAQSVPIPATTAGRDASVEQAFKKVLFIAAAAETFATDTANPTLRIGIHLNKGRFHNLRLLQKVPYLRGILATAAAYKASLVAYGVQESHFTAAEAAINAFEAVEISPLAAIGARARVTAALQDVMDAGREALRKMDRLLIQFEDSEPEFVKGFTACRKLHKSTGHRYEVDKEKVD